MSAARVLCSSLFASAFACSLLFTAKASAQDRPEPAPERGPRVGGHLGFALPIVTVASTTTAIGADFVAVGITPGVTVKLSERWALDFEFIAFNELKRTPSATTFVVDPGVVYSGDSIAVGLRVATQVGAPTNVGLVPIVVLPVSKVGDSLTYFVEADVPLFLRDGGSALMPSVGLQFQSGFAF